MLPSASVLCRKEPMKHTHPTRIKAFLLAAAFLLTVCIMPLTVTAADPVPSAQILLSDTEGILSVSLQLRGTDLARTQCLSLSYDAAVLTLLSNDGTPAVPSAQMCLLDADTIAEPAEGWSCGLVRTVSDSMPTAELGTAADGRGLLLLYPTADAPVSYAAYTTVLTLRFSCDEQHPLSASSLRLLSYTEQEQLSQSVKLLLCTSDRYYTYGAFDGNDTLSAPAFLGHSVICGAQEDESAQPNAPWQNPFTDITEETPYYDAISYVAQRGLFVGDEQNRFQPYEPMNRATFATVLYRLDGNTDVPPAVGEDTGFSDVRSDDWFAPYVLWSASQEIFLGYGNGCFGPNDPVTHEQMYLLIQRFTESHSYSIKPHGEVSLSSLADADAVSPWAVDAVRFAFANGLLIADAARTIRPTQEAARWELAVLLQSLEEIEQTTGTASARLINPAAANTIPQAPPAEKSAVSGAVQTIQNGLLTLTEKINISAFRLNYEQFVEAYHEAAKQPEFFYVDNLYYFTYHQFTGEILTVTPTYTMRGTELREAQTTYNAALNELLSGVDRRWTEFEKVLYLHDLLATRYIYDETLGTFDALSLMTGGRGVCQAYTLVMQACLNALGIENSRVTSIEMNHTWNLVRVNGHWYHMDVTWDDPRTDQHGQVQHVYFLKSDAYMRANKHYNWACFDEIACTDTTYDNAFFNHVRTPIVSGGDGYYYYISNTSGALFRWDPNTDSRARVCTTGIHWTTSEGVYQSMYTGLVRIDGILLYNSSDSIIAYHIDTGITETIHTTTAAGYICGLSLTYSEDSTGSQVPYLVYQVRPSPASENGTLYRISAKNLFTYTVTASMRGYFADSSTKIRLVRNGTISKTITLPRTGVYGECVQTFSIDGVRSGRYDLIIEKKNCLPYTVKSIDVSAFTDLTAVYGPLPLLCGDFNGDGAINDADRSLLLHQNTFRHTTGGALTPGADINGDGIIDIVDYAILTEPNRFGYTKEMCTVTHKN